MSPVLPGYKPDTYNDASSVRPPQPSPESPGSTGTSKNEPIEPVTEPAMLFCPVCSTRLASRQCKLFCQQCGYYMSCADYI